MTMNEMGARAKTAARALANAGALKESALLHAAGALLGQIPCLRMDAVGRREELLAANALDVQAGREAGMSRALLDRLSLTEARIQDMAAAVEEVCDQIEGELQGQFPGCFFPFRFSPGYGDLPLTLQGSLLNLLDAPRRVGLCASSTHILTPRKSVTAILGIADHPMEANTRSCVGCPAHDGCQYRKSGGHCGIS